mgnify:CR=1 FL=1
MGRRKGNDLHQRTGDLTDVRVHRAILFRGGPWRYLGHKQDWALDGIADKNSARRFGNVCYEASHGDTQHIVLIPGTVDECFEFGWRAFDYAERFQTLVFGFGDLDLGMNRWNTSGLSLIHI